MSIINLEKTFENNPLVYCNLNNKIIIKCVCLTKLFKLNKCYNKKFLYFMCNKIKIITIYDIHKNIIYKPVYIDIFKKQIKINEILENLKEKNIICFKTFIGAFITNNKLNDIKYHLAYKGYIWKISYDITNFFCYKNYPIIFTICNKNNWTYDFYININKYDIYYYKNNKIYINICYFNNKIKMIKYYNNSVKIIYCHKKNLEIFKIVEYYKNIKIYKEKRNSNNEITNLKKYNYIGVLEEDLFINNINPSFSKLLKNFYIILINFYNENIIDIHKKITFALNKYKKAKNNLLLRTNLEIINYK